MSILVISKSRAPTTVRRRGPGASNPRYDFCFRPPDQGVAATPWEVRHSCVRHLRAASPHATATVYLPTDGTGDGLGGNGSGGGTGVGGAGFGGDGLSDIDPPSKMNRIHCSHL